MLAGYGGGVDDEHVFGLGGGRAEHAHALAVKEEDRAQVDVELHVQSLGLDVSDGRADADAGVVDEHVEAPVVLAMGRDDLLDLGLIGDVRGMGLLQALELVKDRQTKEPAAQEANQIMERTRANGLLVGKGGLYSNTIRMAPPMNISKADVDEGIRLLDKSFSEVRA